MHVIDPGHCFALDSLDGHCLQTLIFVKREGPKYPGNIGSHPGTTMQEVLRALISRAIYVNNQTPCDETILAIEHMKAALMKFEERAAIRHGRDINFSTEYAVAGTNKCHKCGHVGCLETCK